MFLLLSFRFSNILKRSAKEKVQMMYINIKIYKMETYL